MPRKMIKRAVRAMVVGITLLAGIALHAGDAHERREILTLEELLAKAWLKHDTATINEMVSDDFQYWSYKGVRKNKADLLRLVEKNDEGDTRIEDADARVYGDAAVYTARIIDTGKDANGATSIDKSCVTDVFIRREGKWQLVASHETRITDSQ